MQPTPKQLKLLQALLKNELSVNAVILGLYRIGFNYERNVHCLGTEIMELVGFSEEACESDELLHFYVRTLDQLTEEYLLKDTGNIDEVAMLFYSELLGWEGENC
jgi:hypothetical protein